MILEKIKSYLEGLEKLSGDALNDLLYVHIKALTQEPQLKPEFERRVNYFSILKADSDFIILQNSLESLVIKLTDAIDNVKAEEFRQKLIKEIADEIIANIESKLQENNKQESLSQTKSKLDDYLKASTRSELFDKYKEFDVFLFGSTSLLNYPTDNQQNNFCILTNNILLWNNAVKDHHPADEKILCFNDALSCLTNEQNFELDTESPEKLYRFYDKFHQFIKHINDKALLKESIYDDLIQYQILLNEINPKIGTKSSPLYISEYKKLYIEDFQACSNNYFTCDARVKTAKNVLKALEVFYLENPVSTTINVNNSQPQKVEDPEQQTAPKAKTVKLKPAEKEHAPNILQAYADGAKSRKEISDKINLSESRIREIEEAIKHIYNVKTTQQMLMKAAQENIVELPQI